jgi:hypothetical protein
VQIAASALGRRHHLSPSSSLRHAPYPRFDFLVECLWLPPSLKAAVTLFASQRPPSARVPSLPQPGAVESATANAPEAAQPTSTSLGGGMGKSIGLPGVGSTSYCQVLRMPAPSFICVLLMCQELSTRGLQLPERGLLSSPLNTLITGPFFKLPRRTALFLAFHYVDREGFSVRLPDNTRVSQSLCVVLSMVCEGV